MFDPRDRAFGHNPDDELLGMPQVQDHFGSGRAGSIEPPAEFSLDHLLYARPASRPDLPEQLLQYSTSTCVTYGMSALLWAEQRRLGVPPEECVLASTKAAYYAGLRRENGLDARLVDAGSRPRDVWSAAREVGVVEWEQCPLLEHQQDKLLDQCHDGAWLAGSERDYLRDLRYDTVALSQRRDMAQRTIFAGHPFGMGLTVYASFDDVYSTPWAGRQGPSDPRTGRHYVIGFAYDPVGVYIQHWWRGWGKPRCIGQITWDVVCSPETTDLITAVLDLEKW